MLDGRYDTDLTDAAWELVKPLMPAARHGGRPRTTDVRVGAGVASTGTSV
jgi:transposase